MQEKNDNAILPEDDAVDTQELKLDYTIQSPEERNELVKKIVDSLPPQKLTKRYLEILADYIIFAMTKEEKKSKQINTDNRMITINKRQTSFQGLVGKFENGEDGVYNLFTEDKNIIFTPKISITEEDLAEIPALRDLRAAIAQVQKIQKTARGKRKYLLKKQIIQMRQDQYILKSAYKPPVAMMKVTKSVNQIDLDEHITVDENGDPVSDCLISLFNPHHVCCLLCNYSKLKEDCWGHFDSDWWYLMENFDNLLERALKEDYPILYDIVAYKIDGLQNKDIAMRIKQDYNVSYSVEYLSAVWRKKIPKIIADKAKEEWIVWYYTHEEKGKWKRCSRCHEIKLAHPYFFTRNKTAKDGWYSMCKCCRNKKKIKIGKDKSL